MTVGNLNYEAYGNYQYTDPSILLENKIWDRLVGIYPNYHNLKQYEVVSFINYTTQILVMDNSHAEINKSENGAFDIKIDVGYKVTMNGSD